MHALSYTNTGLMDSLTIKDLLEADSRPTFVVQLALQDSALDVLQPCYINPALHQQLDAQEELFHRPSDKALWQEFVRWVYTGKTNYRSTHEYCSVEWHRISIADKWLVISATTEQPLLRACVAYSGRLRYPEWHYSNDLDWTRTRNVSQLPTHVQYLRKIDWSKTDYGPMCQWPIELRVVFNAIMRSKSPMMLQWGENICTIYNEAFIPIAGQKHPASLGAQLEDMGRVEFEGHYASIYKHAYEYGLELAHENPMCVMLDLVGSVQECYFNFEMLPVIGPSTKSHGNLTKLVDVTESVLSQRRLQTMLAISQLYKNTISLEELWQGVLEALEANKEDVPFAVLYSVDDVQKSAAVKDSTITQTRAATATVVGSVGEVAQVVQERTNFYDCRDPMSQALRRCDETLQQVELNIQDGTLPKSIVQAISPTRGHGAGCGQALLFPLKTANEEVARGFLLVGLNQRCPYNDSYKGFLISLSAQLNSALAATLTLQEAIRNKHGQDVLIQAELKEKLEEQRRMVEASERRFERLIDNSMAAICISRTDGSMIYVNKKWHELYGGTEADLAPMAWLARIAKEDLETAMSYFADVANGSERGEVEIRLNKTWCDPSAPDMTMPYTWVVVTGYAEFDENGAIKYLAGASVDISHQKWVLGESQRREVEAMEAKRRQDAFTDMVAHEIRNPLNAIMQCSDVVQEAMRALQDGKYDSRKVSESIENAETISLCAAHQKKIVNDLLTLSKLDSDLLTFSPISSRPEKIIQQAIRIFESGSKQNDISLTYRIDPSVAQFEIDWMLLDADRTLQVLINLITNAIKFTTGRPKRCVTVSMSAADDFCIFAREHSIKFFPSKGRRLQSAPSEKDIFLLFSVEDTGRGISAAEEERLFHRFSQASLRTHVDFGGSGLGLWISRELAEMQGGEIGFVPGKLDGCLFAFYVRTQHANLAKSTSPDFGMTTEKNDSLESLLRRLSHASVNSESAHPEDSPVRPKTDLSTITVLLTEDNIVNQKVMKKQLAKHFKQVLVANHGQEALDLLEANRQTSNGDGSVQLSTGRDRLHETDNVDLILMDIEMPVMNGIECTKKIREKELSKSSDKRIPIIAISANARVEQVNEYKSIGMDDVVSKPFLIKDLLAVVRQLL